MSKKYNSGAVSVILVNFRGAPDTINAYKGLKALNWPAHLLEILILDNNSGDGSVERLKASCPDAKIIESKTNLGFAGGCNLAAKQAKGEFLGFLNNDARPDVDWVSSAIETFYSGQDIAAVASKVLDWQGTHIDYVDGAISWTGMAYKPNVTSPDSGEWDVPKDVLFGTGAAMFVRAEIFSRVGGFDESFFMFFEDVDLGWRLNLLGYRFRYQPQSVAFHKHHASMEKFGNFRELYLLERNALSMLYKNLDADSLKEVLPSALLMATRRATARGEIDSAALDITRESDDSVGEIPTSKQALAGYYAMDQFIDLLPDLIKKRSVIQSTRVKSDAELKRLFGNTDHHVSDLPSYLSGHDKVRQAFGTWNATYRRNVLVVTGDAIGPRMAGPAIRAWHIAKTLSAENNVRVVSTNKAVPLDTVIDVGVVSIHHPESIKVHEEWADIIIIQGYPLWFFPALEHTSKFLVVDIYDPMHLEQLEQARGKTLEAWNSQILGATEVLNHQMLLGDFFLCASDRQRHFWLGQLAALGRINAHTYLQDSELESLLAIAPFGISEEPPTQTSHGIRGAIPGITDKDKVIVWAGGIYNWFDPATLIRAVAEIATRQPNIKLFFMGVKHPNPDVPEMEAVSASRILATELGVNGVNVFFNEDWVPFDERQNYLLDADLGVSTHFQHVETVFSFRTRILDYLWAGLPIVTTGGDPFGDLVEKEGLGAVVQESDVSGLALALESLLFEPEALEKARFNVQRVRETFYWSKALEPLVEFCRNPLKAADRSAFTVNRKDSRNSQLPTPGKNRTKAKKPNGLAQDFRSFIKVLTTEGPSQVFAKLRNRRARKAGQLN